MTDKVRKRDLMPKEGDPDWKNWHRIHAGDKIDVLFNPSRQLSNTADNIERLTVVVGAAGKVNPDGNQEQTVRIDPFSEKKDGTVSYEPAHYHPFEPGPGPQIPLVVEKGQTALDAALAFCEEPQRFRNLLTDAGEPDVAAALEDADILGIPAQVRKIYQQSLYAQVGA